MRWFLSLILPLAQLGRGEISSTRLGKYQMARTRHQGGTWEERRRNRLGGRRSQKEGPFTPSSSGLPRDDTQVYHRLEPPQPIMCYSCMNMNFKHHWHKLRHFYYPQKNFTDDCISMGFPQRIPLVQCPHSICISLFEPRYIAGYYAGSNVVRGCLSNLFHFGYQGMTAAGQMDALVQGSQPDFCSTTSATELFPAARRQSPRSRSSRKTVATRPIKYCVCVGSHCNVAVSSRASDASSRSLFSFSLLCLMAAALFP